MATHYIPSGTTEPQVFEARIDDAIEDMTGMTVALEVTDKDGTTVTVTGAVDWLDATLAQWSYTPDDQLTEALSPYAVRLAVTDGAGDVVKFPNTRDADTWWVVDP